MSKTDSASSVKVRSRATLFWGLVLLWMIGAIVYIVFAPDRSPLLDAKDFVASRGEGEYLVRAADCVACHSVAEGEPFAGGLKMSTPLGAIYSTNITPDPDTGIGSYSLAEFERAVRRGIAKDGHRLYPAMPYPSYAKLTDEDVAKLYSYFMEEVRPIRRQNTESEIPAVLAFRWPLAIWNTSFARGGSYQVKATHDAVWNRGAYLVQGPGHCGACHTPRGVGVQEKALDETSSHFLAGAEIDAWYAPSLRGEVQTGIGTWSEKDVFDFLKHGHNRIGSSFGSMTEVINNSTSYLSDEDLTAMAVYLKSLPARSKQEPLRYEDETTTALLSAPLIQPGAAVYAGACSSCHGFNGKGFPPHIPAIAGNPVVLDHEASSLINVVLNGSIPRMPRGEPAAYRMPQFRENLSDEEVAAVVTFMRTAWGHAASNVSTARVAEIRVETSGSTDEVTVLRMR